MHRRDLFRPRQLARGAGHVLGVLEELRGTPAPPARPHKPPQTPLLRLARRAMATTFEVLLPAATAGGLEAGEAALDEVDRLEAQLTVYRDDSEVSRLNQQAVAGPVPVEPRLFELLQTAAQITAETAGAFDITAGPLIKAWGFFRRSGRVPTVEERAEVLQSVGMHHVELDASRGTVRYRRPGVEINLGSIGKGYALDRAVELLRDGHGISAALLHGGHSSVYALGSEPGSRSGWAVGVRHPWHPERRLAVVWLRDQALATSAATFQHLEHEGRKLGHLLDPRTGWPAEGIASATVIAPTAALADALATAFFIQGVDWARDYCAAHPGIAAIFQLPDDDAPPVLIGLAPDEPPAR